MRNLNHILCDNLSDNEREENTSPPLFTCKDSSSSSSSSDLSVRSTEAIVTFPDDDNENTLVLLNNNSAMSYTLIPYSINSSLAANNEITNNTGNSIASFSNIPNQIIIPSSNGNATVGISHFYGLNNIQATGDPNAIAQVLNTGVIKWSTCATMTLTIILGIILSLGAILIVIFFIYGIIYIATALISGAVLISIVLGILYCLHYTVKAGLIISQQNNQGQPSI